MNKKCEACQEAGIQSSLNTFEASKNYELCANCLPQLINCSLEPKQFKNLIRAGHNDTEFYLHGDFYSEDGVALQPHN